MYDLYRTSGNVFYVSTIISDLDPIPFHNQKIVRSIDNGKTWETIFECDGFFLGINSYLFSWKTDSLFVSKDKGITWNLIHNSKNPIKGIDQFDDGTLFMSTGQGSYSSNLFKSTNNGNSWEQIPVVSDNFSFFVAPEKLFISNQSKLYLYNNLSNTFEEIIDKVYPLNIVAINSNIVVSTNNSGIYLSEDDGDNWNNISLSYPELNILVFGKNNRLIAPYRYTDDLRTWYRSTGATDIQSIAVNSIGNIYILGYGRDFYESIDNGISFTELTMQGLGPGFQVEEITISEDDILFLSKSHDGIYKSENGGKNWDMILSSNKWNSELVYKNNLLCIGTEDGIMVSKDKGVSWDSTNFNQRVIQITLNSQNDIFASSYDGIWKSKDYGVTWEYLVWNFRELFIGKEDEVYIGLSEYGAFYSTDSGASWNEIELVRDKEVKSVLIDEQNGIVLLGTKRSGLIKGQIN